MPCELALFVRLLNLHIRKFVIVSIPVIVAVETSWQPNGTLLRSVENELPLFQKATPTTLRRFGAHILYLGSLVNYSSSATVAGS